MVPAELQAWVSEAAIAAGLAIAAQDSQHSPTADCVVHRWRFEDGRVFAITASEMQGDWRDRAAYRWSQMSGYHADN